MSQQHKRFRQTKKSTLFDSTANPRSILKEEEYRYQPLITQSSDSILRKSPDTKVSKSFSIDSKKHEILIEK